MNKMIYKIFLYAAWLVLANVILNTQVNATQIVDKLPVELKGSWSRCIYFESSNPICTNASTTRIDEAISKPVNQFIYKTDFIINSELQTFTVGIWLDVVDDVDEVRVNSYLVGSIGQFPPYFQSGFRYKRLYLIPTVIMKFNQLNHLEIKTFSSVNKAGLNSHPIVLGNYFEFSHKQKQDYIYVFCISTL